MKKLFNLYKLILIAGLVLISGAVYCIIPYLQSTLGSGQKAAVFNSRVTSTQNQDYLKDVYIIQDDGSLIKDTGQVDTLAVARKFYALNPDKKNFYDFISLFSTFYDPNTVAYHFPLQSDVKGPGSVPASVQDGLPKKLLGINFLNDGFSSKYVPDEERVVSNLYLMDHETGHQWIAYLNKINGITDGSHYSKWLNNGFLRDGKWWGDVMQGWPWEESTDGTFSVNDIYKQGFSKLSLYLMGFAPISEVPELQVVVPQNPTEESFHGVKGALKTIKTSEIISKYGNRVPSYQNSQKDFNMAYILLTKKNEDYQADLRVIEWIAKNFPNEWNTITYGRSTMNNFSAMTQNSNTSKINGGCGFNVSNVAKNSLVSFPLTVKGIINNSNSKKIGCSWQMFGGQAGSAQIYYKSKYGWQKIGASVPIKVANWTSLKTNFVTTINFNNGGIGLPNGTQMKVVFTEENASGLSNVDTVELPFILK